MFAKDRRTDVKDKIPLWAKLQPKRDALKRYISLHFQKIEAAFMCLCIFTVLVFFGAAVNWVTGFASIAAYFVVHELFALMRQTLSVLKK